MKIKFIGEIAELLEGISELREFLGIEIDDNGAEINAIKCEKGFSVLVKDNKAEIKYATTNVFFRALAIAMDALKNGKEVELTQVPEFKTCGVMVDASRRAVPTVETIKKFMRIMACMGLNRIMLYTEDTYEMEKYPYFGYMRGRYTKEELKEVVRYGNMLGIESVPCIQTLAHLEMALKWDAFDEIRDTGNILLADEEKTYEFIEDIMKTMRECFTSNEIHVGMDEAFGVGLGKYLEIHGYTDSLGILCRHLNRVTEIARKYDFNPMMWSDMLVALAEKNNTGEIPDDIAKMLPEGVGQVCWDYYRRSEKQYDEEIAKHQKFKSPILFAGGVWTWSGPSVNYAQTFESTIPALRVCKKYGVEHVFATLWGDDGAECDMFEALYGVQLFAEMTYNNSLKKAELDKMFKICTGCDAEAFLLLDTDNYYKKECTPEKEVFDDETYLDGILTFTKQVLCQNPIMGLFDKNHALVDLKKHYQDLWAKVENMDYPKEYEDMFEYHKQLVKVLVSKSDIGLRIKKAYDSDNKAELADIEKELYVLADGIDKLSALRSVLWYKNNKPFGFESVGNRLAGIASMTRTAAVRLGAYVNGQVASLEEVEVEKLYYNSNEKPFIWQFTGWVIMMP